MPNHTEVVTVTDEVTIVTGDRVTDGYEQSVSVEWLSGDDVFVGGEDVAATGTEHLGRKLNADRTEFQVKTDGQLGVICADGETASVHIFRTHN